MHECRDAVTWSWRSGGSDRIESAWPTLGLSTVAVIDTGKEGPSVAATEHAVRMLRSATQILHRERLSLKGSVEWIP